MRLKDIMAILAVAAVTATFTIVLVGPSHVTATEGTEAISPVIARPEMSVDGCTFSLSTDKTAYEPGEMPVLRIEATNPTDQLIETAISLRMTAISPESFLSRMPVAPSELWSAGDLLVSLEAGETKTFLQPTETELSAGQSVSIMLGSQQQEILIQDFGVN